MIRLEIADEPEWFDAEVRQPGLRALRELHGEALPGDRRSGPRRSVPDRITTDHLTDYWTRCIRYRCPDGAEDGLYARYRAVCAYLSLWLPPGISCPTVDHAVPKGVCLSRGRAEEPKIYDWGNYRLAALSVNGFKGEDLNVIDPAQIDPAICGGVWFHLRFPDCAILPNPDLHEALRDRVAATIALLRLDTSDIRTVRAEHYDLYLATRDLSFLQRRAPFVAAEIRRQGLDG